MALIYTTKQNQTVDLACDDHYGQTDVVTEIVLKANPGLADLGEILPLGTKITMPDYKPAAKNSELVDLWS